MSAYHGMKLRLPPRIKVLEAISSISAGRIKKESNGIYKIRSSRGEKEYIVIIKNSTAYSNDNGTIFKGYIGYPIIAALMIEGILPKNEKIGEAIKDIPWADLNESLKSYKKVEEKVKEEAKKNGVQPDEIDEYVESVMEALKMITLKFKDMRQLGLE
ncbi:MAG: hypothetical protein ACP5LX_03315 [Nitrososphaeria archaeon]